MFGKIEDAIKELQRGDFIVIVDDENRENEGDLVLAAEKVTPSKLNYMINWAIVRRGNLGLNQSLCKKC